MSQVGSVYRFDGIGLIWVSCGMSETEPEKQEPPKKALSPAAKRALAEAEARRQAREAEDHTLWRLGTWRYCLRLLGRMSSPTSV